MCSKLFRAAVALLVLALVAIGGLACIPESQGDPSSTGEANVSVAVQALASHDNPPAGTPGEEGGGGLTITVTVTGPGIAAPIVAKLQPVKGGWQGTIGKIPVGTGRIFTGAVYSPTNEVLYTAEVTGVTISSGPPVVVLLSFQQATPPNPFGNSAPQIGSLLASAGVVEPGQQVFLEVSASDPNGDPLTYAWSAPGGTFANGASAAPTWTAPATEGSYPVSVSVTDGKGGQAGITVVLQSAAKGSATVTTTFNAWPIVTLVTATPGQLAPGGTTALGVLAADPEGDPLAYLWTSSCAGTFSDATAPASTWTAPGQMIPACTLSVAVNDGLGGVTTGSLVVGVNLPPVNLPPVIDQTFQSIDAVFVGDTVSLGVTASDPENKPLTFVWTADGGLLGTPVSTAGGSDVEWTATAGGSFLVTAEVVDPGGAKAAQEFAVEVAPMPASCAGLPPTCGPGGDEICCASPFVPGGTYDRSNDASHPATVSDFRLDRFEITVGRFRAFLNAYPESKPAAGAGAHPLIPGSGWDPAWDAALPVDQAALIAAVSGGTYHTWTPTPGAHENRPMNRLTWYHSFAFCAWDGGRLPTEAEWNYATAGGDEQRTYAWGSAAPDPAHASYGCTGDGSPEQPVSCTVDDILNVGLTSPLGDGKWGQADLTGNMWEWNLDWYAASYSNPCVDCANLIPAPNKVLRGGSFTTLVNGNLQSYSRIFNTPAYFADHFSARCARSP